MNEESDEKKMEINMKKLTSVDIDAFLDEIDPKQTQSQSESRVDKHGDNECQNCEKLMIKIGKLESQIEKLKLMVARGGLFPILCIPFIHK